MHIGRGHTAGDVVAYVPDANVVFSGDLVEYHSACYCGDAHFTDWPATLDRLAEFRRKRAGAGPRRRARRRAEQVAEGIDADADFLPRSIRRRRGQRRQGPHAQGGLRRRAPSSWIRNSASFAIYEHCMPFNVSRAYDEAKGIEHAGDLDRGARPRHVGGFARMTLSRHCGKQEAVDRRVGFARSAGPVDKIKDAQCPRGEAEDDLPTLRNNP